MYLNTVERTAPEAESKADGPGVVGVGQHPQLGADDGRVEEVGGHRVRVLVGIQHLNKNISGFKKIVILLLEELQRNFEELPPTFFFHQNQKTVFLVHFLNFLSINLKKLL